MARLMPTISWSTPTFHCRFEAVSLRWRYGGRKASRHTPHPHLEGTMIPVGHG
jgi:hypothetical protein